MATTTHRKGCSMDSVFCWGGMVYESSRDVARNFEAAIEDGISTGRLDELVVSLVSIGAIEEAIIV